MQDSNDDDGESVILTNVIHTNQPWASPAHALRHWAAHADFTGPGLRRGGNGLQQSEDVRERSEFATLHVSTNWRQVTFERPQATADSSRMSEADDTYWPDGCSVDVGEA